MSSDNGARKPSLSTFLLLNRVLQKPYTEAIESDGKADEVVAEQSWINNLKRNQYTSLLAKSFFQQEIRPV